MSSDQNALQKIQHDDSELANNITATVQTIFPPREVTQHLSEDRNSLPGAGEASEATSPLDSDGSAIKGDASDDSDSTATASLLSQHDLARLTYSARKKSRCIEHVHVEEWIACPQCTVSFDALNEFATYRQSNDGSGSSDQSILKEEHMMIMGVDQGWDKLRTQPEFDSSWERQAKFDGELEQQRIVRPVDRLAYFIIRYWWQFRSAPSDKRSPNMLLAFLRPIPAQLSTAHDAAIDICPFPKIRHRLILNSDQYKTDYFWQPYVTGIRFFWPFEFADAITQDSRTGLYQFSLAFRQAICHPENWSLAGEFFDVFPEFHGDAPIFDPGRTARPILAPMHWSKQQSMLLHKKQCSAVTSISEVASCSGESNVTRRRRHKRIKTLSTSLSERKISLQHLPTMKTIETSIDIDEEFWRASGCR